MEITVLCLCILCYTVGNACQNRFSSTLEGRLPVLGLFLACWMGLAAAVFLLVGLMSQEVSFQLVTAVTAALAGLCTVLSGVGLIGAFSCGSMSMTMLIFSMSVVVPPALSILFLHETPTLAQFAGLLLIIAVLVVANGGRSSDEKKGNGKWLALALLSAVSSGGVNFLSKLHQTALPGREEIPYSFLCYLTGGIFALLLSLLLRRLAGKEGKDAALFLYNERLLFAGCGRSAFSWGRSAM